MITVHHGDCREIAPTLGQVDAVVTDPPYGLEFMNVAWDTMRPNGKPRERNEWGDFGSREHPRSSEEAGHVRLKKSLAFEQFSREWANAAYTILRPGGFLVAFGGTRTYHRMACAIEDAGFVIQDCLMWLYATGFPKRKDALKPSYEPIVLAYKPGGKRTMQVDECRIEGGREREQEQGNYIGSVVQVAGPRGGGKVYPASLGRWPANICHDGSGEVVACFPESESVSGGNRGSSQIWGQCNGDQPRNGFDDAGSAARFFFSAKAGTQDRWGSKHPTVKPVDLIAWLVKLVTPPGGTFLDPFAGSGTAAVAALKTGRNAILIEREAAYVADIKERIAFYQGGGQHSTQAKNRNRKVDYGPLFEPAPLSPEEDAADSLASYNAAIIAIGERVKAGEPVPEFMRSRKGKF